MGGSTYSDPVLPFDVFALIIQDSGANVDNRTLKQCSLVCRAFCAFSQRVLFSSVKGEAVDLSRTLGTAPHLAKYVTALHLALYTHDREDVAALVTMMGNIRSLVLDGGGEYWNKLTSPVLLACFQKDITNLRLEYIRNFPFSVLQCPHIHTVTLEDVTPMENEASQDTYPLPNLRSLILLRYTPEHFQRDSSLMMLLSRSNGLESLVFGPPRVLKFANFEPFVALYMHSLKFLHTGPLERL